MKKSKATVTRSAAELAKALGLTPADGAEIALRSDLNSKIVEVVRRKGATHAQVARLARTSRTRVTAIMNRNTKDISTDLLLRNESILSDLPLFEPAEPNPMPPAAWPIVGADKGPVVHRAVAFDKDVVHQQLHIWKRGHESLRHLGDGAAPGSQSAINAERAVRGEKRGHARGLPAAPRRRIAPRKN